MHWGAQMKKTLAALSIALVLTSSLPASALMVVGQPTPPPPSAAALGVGGGFAVGIIATAALLCIYDVWLKVNGLKNWDGSAKVVQVQAHHHHHL